MFPDSINCGDSSLLAIRFNPLATGQDSATISIENNDIDEYLFTFVISGTLDTIKPLAICKETTVYLDIKGMTSIDASYINNGSSDNCAIATLALSQEDFICTHISSSNSVTLTVSDINDNVNTCTANVMVLDTIRPTVVCKTRRYT